jgi:hypothetical protein
VISSLNTFEFEALRVYATTGKLPRLMVIAALRDAGLLTNAPYFRLAPGVREELAQILLARRGRVVRVLAHSEHARALEARKVPATFND